MNQQGLDEIDRRILDLIRDNARLRYSEIGQMVGISRVSVRNRMEQMEKSGVIRGYRTVMDQTMVPQGSRFFLDLETPDPPDLWDLRAEPDPCRGLRSQSEPVEFFREQPSAYREGDPQHQVVHRHCNL